MEQKRYERFVEWGYRIVFTLLMTGAALSLWRAVSS